jgi:CBS domain containing-hemolysin-like protein
LSVLVFVAFRPFKALAGGGGFGGSHSGPMVPLERKDIISLSALFLGLFIGLALLHACEIAITTLYPWKVREIAEEEEKQGKTNGVFSVLNDDITKVLTTILVTSTACSIFATTLFTHLVANLFGTRGERYGAIALTGLTLFFVELLPKSLGVTNAEVVARFMVPPVNVLSLVVSPLGVSLSWLAKKTLVLLGMKVSNTGDGVSDSQLRLIVTGALDSGTIDHGEQEMIQGVLNLQDQRIKEIMRPRVEIVAVPCDSSVVSVLGVVRESGYSRIPVYDGEIDNVVGVVLAKSVLDFFVYGVLVDEDETKEIHQSPNGADDSVDDAKASLEISVKAEADEDVDDDHSNVTAAVVVASKEHASSSSSSPSTRKLYEYSQESVALKTNKGGSQGYVRSLTPTELAKRMEMSIKDASLIEPCYFVPDTANGWSVLQEMRRRRVHMAIVVDEFGGTEGLVSLEDIVEEVVGEIYDEDDEEDFEFSEDSITLREDGTFIVRGDADLEDCNTILGLELAEGEELKDFSTLSGFLCYCAGEIPRVGDFIMSRGWSFEILNADDKKILVVKVERLVGALEEPNDIENNNENPLKVMIKRNLHREGSTSSNDDDQQFAFDIDEQVDDEFRELVEAHQQDAYEVERMVESSERKRDLLEAVKQMVDDEAYESDI